MSTCGARWVVPALALLATLFAGEARAGVCVLAEDPDSVERVIVVESISSAANGRWLSLELRRPTRVAWLVEEPDGLAIEPRGGPFLDALDGLSAPFVEVPPATLMECDTSRVLAFPRRVHAPVAARRVRRFEDSDALDAALGASELDAAACEPNLPALLVEFEGSEGPARTDAVRVFGPRALEDVRSAFATHGTFLTLGPGRATPHSLAELSVEELELTFFVAGGRNDYERARDAALARAAGSVSLLESVSPVWLPEGTAVEQLPLFRRYSRELGIELEGTRCLEEQSRALARGAPRTVARACPTESPVPASGWPAPPDCTEDFESETISPALFRCGGADDWALALSGLAPRSTWLTRAFVRIEPGARRSVEFESARLLDPKLDPTIIDSTGCAPPVAPTPLPGTRAPGGYAPGEIVPRPPQLDEAATTTEVDVLCSADTRASEDSCSGDTSSSDSDSCSGDSSTSSDEEASCSGDSSTSSDEEASCKGDSSASSDEEASCEGDSSSTEDEEGACSSGSSTAESTLRSPLLARTGSPPRACVRRGRPRRTRLSVWTVALAAIWLPVRRFGRERTSDRGVV